MLNRITPAIQTANPDTLEALLLGCHERIRHFSGVAKRLAHAQGAAPEEVAQAAAGLYRYFTVALPLHEADENLSIHPRMRQAVHNGQVAAAVDAMVEQHHAIDQVVEELLPLWKVLGSNPAKLDEFSTQLCRSTTVLGEMFGAHLKLEEEIIFPALRDLLSEDQIAEIVDEMQQRRKT